MNLPDLETLNSKLVVARTELNRLRVVAESATAAYVRTYGDDIPLVSGGRREYSGKVEAHRSAAASREAGAWAAVSAKEAEIDWLAARIDSADVLEVRS